jgi:uncharacterized membrane protein
VTAFTVWRFGTIEGAEHVHQLLEQAEKDGLVKIVDHAVVTWPVGAPSPEIEHCHDETWRGAGWGAMWGLLVGAMITIPVLGVAAGAGLGALAKSTEKLGISEEQLTAIGEGLTPGTSALFLVTQSGDLDRLGERLRGVDMKLLETNLTGVERSMLDESLGR